MIIGWLTELFLSKKKTEERKYKPTTTICHTLKLLKIKRQNTNQNYSFQPQNNNWPQKVTKTKKKKIWKVVNTTS